MSGQGFGLGKFQTRDHEVFTEASGGGPQQMQPRREHRGPMSRAALSETFQSMVAKGASEIPVGADLANWNKALTEQFHKKFADDAFAESGGKVDSEMVKSFQKWIAGKLPYHQVGGKWEYKPVLGLQPHAPLWEQLNRPLYDVPGVKDYLLNNFEKRRRFEDYMSLMAKFGPVGPNGEMPDIGNLFLYYKYHILRLPVPEEDDQFLKDYKLFDRGDVAQDRGKLLQEGIDADLPNGHMGPHPNPGGAPDLNPKRGLSKKAADLGKKKGKEWYPLDSKKVRGGPVYGESKNDSPAVVQARIAAAGKARTDLLQQQLAQARANNKAAAAKAAADAKAQAILNQQLADEAQKAHDAEIARLKAEHAANLVQAGIKAKDDARRRKEIEDLKAQLAKLTPQTTGSGTSLTGSGSGGGTSTPPTAGSSDLDKEKADLLAALAKRQAEIEEEKRVENEKLRQQLKDLEEQRKKDLEALKKKKPSPTPPSGLSGASMQTNQPSDTSTQPGSGPDSTASPDSNATEPAGPDNETERAAEEFVRMLMGKNPELVRKLLGEPAEEPETFEATTEPAPRPRPGPSRPTPPPAPAAEPGEPNDDFNNWSRELTRGPNRVRGMMNEFIGGEGVVSIANIDEAVRAFGELMGRLPTKNVPRRANLADYQGDAFDDLQKVWQERKDGRPIAEVVAETYLQPWDMEVSQQLQNLTGPNAALGLQDIVRSFDRIKGKLSEIKYLPHFLEESVKQIRDKANIVKGMLATWKAANPAFGTTVDNLTRQLDAKVGAAAQVAFEARQSAPPRGGGGAVPGLVGPRSVSSGPKVETPGSSVGSGGGGWWSNWFGGGGAGSPAAPQALPNVDTDMRSAESVPSQPQPPKRPKIEAGTSNTPQPDQVIQAPPKPTVNASIPSSPSVDSSTPQPPPQPKGKGKLQQLPAPATKAEVAEHARLIDGYLTAVAARDPAAAQWKAQLPPDVQKFLDDLRTDLEDQELKEMHVRLGDTSVAPPMNDAELLARMAALKSEFEDARGNFKEPEPAAYEPSDEEAPAPGPKRKALPARPGEGLSATKTRKGTVPEGVPKPFAEDADQVFRRLTGGNIASPQEWDLLYQNHKGRFTDEQKAQLKAFRTTQQKTPKAIGPAAVTDLLKGPVGDPANFVRDVIRRGPTIGDHHARKVLQRLAGNPDTAKQLVVPNHLDAVTIPKPATVDVASIGKFKQLTITPGGQHDEKALTLALTQGTQLDQARQSTDLDITYAQTALENLTTAENHALAQLQNKIRAKIKSQNGGADLTPEQEHFAGLMHEAFANAYRSGTLDLVPNGAATRKRLVDNLTMLRGRQAMLNRDLGLIDTVARLRSGEDVDETELRRRLMPKLITSGTADDIAADLGAGDADAQETLRTKLGIRSRRRPTAPIPALNITQHTELIPKPSNIARNPAFGRDAAFAANTGEKMASAYLMPDNTTYRGALLVGAGAGTFNQPMAADDTYGVYYIGNNKRVQAVLPGDVQEGPPPPTDTNPLADLEEIVTYVESRINADTQANNRAAFESQFGAFLDKYPGVAPLMRRAASAVYNMPQGQGDPNHWVAALTYIADQLRGDPVRMGQTIAQFTSDFLRGRVAHFREEVLAIGAATGVREGVTPSTATIMGALRPRPAAAGAEEKDIETSEQARKRLKSAINQESGLIKTRAAGPAIGFQAAPTMHIDAARQQYLRERYNVLLAPHLRAIAETTDPDAQQRIWNEANATALRYDRTHVETPDFDGADYQARYNAARNAANRLTRNATGNFPLFDGVATVNDKGVVEPGVVWSNQQLLRYAWDHHRDAGVMMEIAHLAHAMRRNEPSDVVQLFRDRLAQALTVNGLAQQATPPVVTSDVLNEIPSFGQKTLGPNTPEKPGRSKKPKRAKVEEKPPPRARPTRARAPGGEPKKPRPSKKPHP